MADTQIKSNISIDEMFEAGAHYGYTRSRRHPSFRSVIFASKNGVDIIDLEKTQHYFDKALEVAKKFIEEGKQILFVGAKSEISSMVKDIALSLDMPFVVNRWIGGTLTNSSEIKKRVARFEQLTSQKERGELSKYTKKEQLLLAREIAKLEKHFGGIVSMKGMPAVMFVIDPRNESIAVKEAQQMNIPVIALSGSDCDISKITYPIPANDSSLASVKLFIEKFKEALNKS